METFAGRLMARWEGSRVAHADDAGIDHFYSAVGSKVRSARAGRGMSQGMLAQQIGFTRSSVANLEAGRQRIALHLFVRIARALDLEPAALLPEGAFSAGGSEVLEELDEHLADTPETTREFVRGAVAQLMPRYER